MTYKTNYSARWIASGLYARVADHAIDYRTRRSVDDIPAEERFAYTLLPKVGADGYREAGLLESLRPT